MVALPNLIVATCEAAVRSGLYLLCETTQRVSVVKAFFGAFNHTILLHSRVPLEHLNEFAMSSDFQHSLLVDRRESRILIRASSVAQITSIVLFFSMAFNVIVSGMLGFTKFWPWPTISQTGLNPPTSYVARVTLGLVCATMHVS